MKEGEAGAPRSSEARASENHLIEALADKERFSAMARESLLRDIEAPPSPALAAAVLAMFAASRCESASRLEDEAGAELRDERTRLRL